MRHFVEEVKLRSGAKGLLINVPGASVMSMRVCFRAGLRYAKKPEIYETAHVVEHLSFGANSKFKSEGEYEAEFTKNGAYHNAWTSDISICYETECADFEWDRILDLKRLAICEPKFNDLELKSEKGNVKSELTGYMNDYNRLLWPRVQQQIGESVANLSERLRTIPNIELKDIREHYRRTHTAKNMRFIIAGNIGFFRKRKILNMLNNWELKDGERFDVPLDTLHSGSPILIRRKDATNLTFGFSFLTPRRLETSESYSIGALNHILTGTMNSKIFGEARKRGLIYSFESGLTYDELNTSWDFSGEVDLENAETLFDLVHDSLEKILNGDLDEKDIEAAKSYMLGRTQISAQTVGNIADFYADEYFKADEIEVYDLIPFYINKINKQEIIDLAREFAGSEISALVAVGSCEKSQITPLAERLKL
ncbi:insulinase family protein [Candidatus Saccharibacteria bacterium]|nr:insulinase family protein [Candidatus Saccharibacteria bacterium]MBQ6605500.1 insulinase family protein [Candidatus Saccharibacteria bacterium]